MVVFFKFFTFIDFTNITNINTERHWHVQQFQRLRDEHNGCSIEMNALFLSTVYLMACAISVLLQTCVVITGELHPGPDLWVSAFHRHHPGQLHHPPHLLPHHPVWRLLPRLWDPLHSHEVNNRAGVVLFLFSHYIFQFTSWIDMKFTPTLATKHFLLSKWMNDALDVSHRFQFAYWCSTLVLMNRFLHFNTNVISL